MSKNKSIVIPKWTKDDEIAQLRQWLRQRTDNNYRIIELEQTLEFETDRLKAIINQQAHIIRKLKSQVNRLSPR